MIQPWSSKTAAAADHGPGLIWSCGRWPHRIQFPEDIGRLPPVTNTQIDEKAGLPDLWHTS